jgi:ankyrin repeat protein
LKMVRIWFLAAAGLAVSVSADTLTDECIAPTVKEVPDTVALLLRALVDPNIPGYSMFGGFYARTVLDMAVESDEYALVEVLLENGANPDKGISYGWGLWNYPPLARCALNAPLAKLLLDSGANPHIRVHSRFSLVQRVGTESLLATAIAHGNFEAVDLFIAYGINPHVEALYIVAHGTHVSTLGLAAFSGNLKIIQLLLDHDVNPTRGYSWDWKHTSRSPASIAQGRDHVEAAKVLQKAELAWRAKRSKPR